jgi:hypothetical protein
MFSSFLRGVMFCLGFILTLIISGGIVDAASGGKFGEIMAKVLGISEAQVLTYS